ncbi:MAG: hypothetical protein R3195_11350 [Gemmatimonadota bacterium]|nr:hypothetical protein [Gemmatimonadota bacterium]
MRRWLTRARGTLGMGLVWAAGGFGLGGVIELIWNIWPGFPLGPVFDIWPAVLAIPGFMGGAAFSVVLGIAGRNRSFDELSLPRFAGWGALGGAALGGLFVALGLGGADAPSLWLRAAMIMGPFSLGSAIAASGSLALARLAEEPRLIEAALESPEGEE